MLRRFNKVRLFQWLENTEQCDYFDFSDEPNGNPGSLVRVQCPTLNHAREACVTDIPSDNEQIPSPLWAPATRSAK